MRRHTSKLRTSEDGNHDDLRLHKTMENANTVLKTLCSSRYLRFQGYPNITIDGWDFNHPQMVGLCRFSIFFVFTTLGPLGYLRLWDTQGSTML